jgi:hypothetical protein
VRLGLRAAARELKISHVALLKAESDGRVPARIGGKFDVELCRAALAANTNPGKSKSARAQQNRPHDPDTQGIEPSGDTLAEASRLHEWEKVRALKLKTDREEGRLVELSVINAFVAGMIMKARDELVRIGAELADSLAQTSDPVKCRALVDDRINQALFNLKTFEPA